MAAEEGPRALFYGLTPGLQRQFLFVGLGNGLYPPIRNAICGDLKPGEYATGPQKVLAGLLTGAIAITVASPTDVAKVRLQTQMALPEHERIYKGVMDLYKKTIAKDGVRGLWLGWGPNVVRNSLINAAEVSTYD